MQDSRKKTIIDLSGGVNKQSKPWFLSPIEAADALNVIYYPKDKAIIKAPGYGAKFTSQTIDAEKDWYYMGRMGHHDTEDLLYWVLDPAGTPAGYLSYVASDSKTDINTALAVFAHTCHMEFIEYNDNTVFNVAPASVYVYENVTHTVSAVAACPSAYTLGSKWGVMFAFNGKDIRWSDTWDHTTWPAANSQNLRQLTGDIRQCVEMECCLYIFCQLGLYKAYYVGGDPFIYIDLVEKFSYPFVPGSATVIPEEKKIIFALENDIYTTNGQTISDIQSRKFRKIIDGISGASTYLTSWTTRQVYYDAEFEVYYLPVKSGAGNWDSATCTFYTIAYNLKKDAFYITDRNFNCYERAVGTNSEMIAMTGDSDVGTDKIFHFNNSTYNYNTAAYNSYFEWGPLSLTDSLSEDIIVYGVELILEGTGEWNITVSKGTESAWDATTHNASCNGSGIIRAKVDFGGGFRTTLLKLKFENNTKDQYFKILGFVIEWDSTGSEMRR